jgi:hypothetical protein
MDGAPATMFYGSNSIMGIAIAQAIIQAYQTGLADAARRTS